MFTLKINLIDGNSVSIVCKEYDGTLKLINDIRSSNENLVFINPSKEGYFITKINGGSTCLLLSIAKDKIVDLAILSGDVE